MTPGQFSARLLRLGLNNRDMAEAYGANIRTVKRWKAGEQDIPKGMEQWLDEYESRSL